MTVDQTYRLLDRHILHWMAEISDMKQKRLSFTIKDLVVPETIAQQLAEEYRAKGYQLEFLLVHGQFQGEIGTKITISAIPDHQEKSLV